MPRIKPLTPRQAGDTLAHRLGGRVDRIRQIATNLGIRPYRVFLTWVKWSGESAGEGEPSVMKRIELLPIPKVQNIDAIQRSLYSAGTLPVGSVRVDRISVGYTEDQLSGRKSGDDSIPDDLDFFYEIVEDGRGDDPAYRNKYRLASQPFRKAGSVYWVVVLERIGASDLGRDGEVKEPDCLCRSTL